MASLPVRPPILAAVQQICRMRGGSQPHLMRASDGALYVVKFQNNPQHVRVLANEFLASRIGCWLGLPMPDVAVMEVCDGLIARTPDLRMTGTGSGMPCRSGLQLAVRYVADPGRERVFDHLPESVLAHDVRIAEQFTRVLVLDKWLGNVDARQAVFSQSVQGCRYAVTFIDQGHCFNAAGWNFPDVPTRGVYYGKAAYQNVTGWESFEPVLSRAEQIECCDLWNLAQGMPEEWWCSQDSGALECLIETLYQRRRNIRDLITAFRESSRNPFPNWTGK